MTTDVLSAIKPQGTGSADFRASLAQIDMQRLRLAAEHTRLTAERAEMIADGGSNADIKRCEAALADLAISRERLDVAAPVQERKLAEAIAREAEAARRDKGEVLAEAIERWNAWVASDVYTKAATAVLEGVALERAVYAAQRAFIAAPRAKPASGVHTSFAASAVPEIAKAYVGGTMRSFESLLRLPSLVPNTPAHHWWLDPGRPTGEAAARAR